MWQTKKGRSQPILTTLRQRPRATFTMLKILELRDREGHLTSLLSKSNTNSSYKEDRVLTLRLR